MSRIALIGGAGFAGEVREIAGLCGHEVVGHVARTRGALDCPYWGEMERLAEHADEFDRVCLAFAAIDRRSAVNRAGVIEWVRRQGFRSCPLVSPHAVRSAGVEIGEGVVVAHGAILSLGCRIGAYSIVNSGAVVGHDAQVGENVTVAPMAFLAGAVSVGEGTLLGPGSLTLQGLSIGRRVVVSVGAKVLRDLPDGATVVPTRSRVLTR